jgi:hypothetical protein
MTRSAMRTNKLVFAVVVALGTAGNVAIGCGGDSGPAAADTSDAAPEAAPAADTGGSVIDQAAPPPGPPTIACTLANGSDPPFFCNQKMVMKALHLYALAKDGTTFASWDSTTGVPDVGADNAPLHDLHDDAAYAAACANYLKNAQYYGDTEITAQVKRDLAAIGPRIVAELATIPTEYGGDLYFHLRDAASGLLVIGQNPSSASVTAIADALGASIFTHFVPLAALPDAGSDAGPGDDAGADAAADADAGPPPLPGDGVLVADPVLRDYAPGDVASGALALVDMAVRHASDDPTHAAAWAIAGAESLAHLTARAKDPATGLYLRLLVPGVSPDRDDVSPRAAAPQDLLATEETAKVAVALFRASALVDANRALAPIAPITGVAYVPRASDAIASAHGTPSLWDGAHLGYFEGYVPSTGALVGTNKLTRANALMSEALRRATVLLVTPYTKQASQMRQVVGETTQLGAGLLAVTSGQSAYFAGARADFTPLEGGGDAGVARPNSFVTSASLAAIEALNAQWVGLPMQP